jgi:hypothetical protein
MDKLCQYCFQEAAENIFQCCKCNIKVHSKCRKEFGDISTFSLVTQLWVCSRCNNSKEGNIACKICAQEDGMIALNKSDNWCHPCCLLSSTKASLLIGLCPYCKNLTNCNQCPSCHNTFHIWCLIKQLVFKGEQCVHSNRKTICCSVYAYNCIGQARIIKEIAIPPDVAKENYSTQTTDYNFIINTKLPLLKMIKDEEDIIQLHLHRTILTSHI